MSQSREAVHVKNANRVKRKNVKYDRQLRLWGAEGQRLLSNSSICVLGTSVLTSEILKNLVLPGIHKFTIVDDVYVHPSDLGANFFLCEEDVGKQRAECLKNSLLQLNEEDVSGEAYIRNVEELIHEEHEKLRKIMDEIEERKNTNESRDDNDEMADGAGGKTKRNGLFLKKQSLYFNKFSLVIGCLTVLNNQMIGMLEEICKLVDIPLVLCQSVGFYGMLRVYAREHLIVEGRKENIIGDLRISEPFDELYDFAANINLSTLDDISYEHIPFIVILIKALQEFKNHRICDKQNNDGNNSDAASFPKTKEEKEHFKNIVKKMQRKPDEQNFIEALDNAYRAFNLYEINDDVQEVLNIAKSKDLHEYDGVHVYTSNDQNENPRANRTQEEEEKKKEGEEQKAAKQKEELTSEKSMEEKNYIKSSEESSDEFCIEKERVTNSIRFWIVAKGVYEFYKAYGKLPLSGFVPDMTADTNSYVELQHIYKKKHEGDTAAVKAFVVDILSNFVNQKTPHKTRKCTHEKQTLSRDAEETSAGILDEQQVRKKTEQETQKEGGRGEVNYTECSKLKEDLDLNCYKHCHSVCTANFITDEYISNFCRNINHIKIINYSSVQKQFSFSSADVLKSFIEEEGDELMNIYIVLWAYNNFVHKYRRSPGSSSIAQNLAFTEKPVGEKELNEGRKEVNFEDECELFLEEVNTIINGLDIRDTVQIEKTYIQQIVRFMGVEMHVTSAFMGGVAAQECVKLISRQFVPLNNTFIYDGINSVAKCLTL